MIFAPTNKRIIRPYDKPSFEHTQRYGLTKDHPLGPAGGLIFFPIFNEGSGNKVFDLSENGHHGTLQGNAAFSAGKFGSAVSGGLDVADNISIPNTTQLTSDLSQVSFVIWAKNNKTSIAGTGIEYLIHCLGGGTDSYVIYWAQNEDFSFQILDAGLGDVGISEVDWLNDDLWHQWVFTYDGATMRMYKDTVEASSTASQTGNINDNGHPIRIGGNGGNGSWDGLIDHVLIYNRALSASEIALLYREPFCMVQKKAAPVYFFVPVGAVKLLAGTVAASSTTTSSLSVSRKLVSTVAVSSTVVGTLSVSRKVVGTIDGLTTVTGTTSVTRQLVGVAISVQSNIAGTLAGIWSITGTIVTQSAVSGSLSVTRKLAGTVTGQSTVSGVLLDTLTGTIDAQSSVSGILNVARSLVGTISPSSSTSGTVVVTWGLISTIVGQSTVAGTLSTAFGLSDFAELKFLDHIVGKVPFARPTVAIGLCTANPGEAGTGAVANEVPNTNDYGRVTTAPDDWNTAVDGEIDNANDITFPEASGSWGEVTHYALFDSSVYGEGNMLVYDKLDVSKDVRVGNDVQFAAGQLKLVLT